VVAPRPGIVHEYGPGWSFSPRAADSRRGSGALRLVLLGIILPAFHFTPENQRPAPDPIFFTTLRSADGPAFE